MDSQDDAEDDRLAEKFYEYVYFFLIIMLTFASIAGSYLWLKSRGDNTEEENVPTDGESSISKTKNTSSSLNDDSTGDLKQDDKRKCIDKVDEKIEKNDISNDQRKSVELRSQSTSELPGDSTLVTKKKRKTSKQNDRKKSQQENTKSKMQGNAKSSKPEGSKTNNQESAIASSTSSQVVVSPKSKATKTTKGNDEELSKFENPVVTVVYDDLGSENTGQRNNKDKKQKKNKRKGKNKNKNEISLADDCTITSPSLDKTQTSPSLQTNSLTVHNKTDKQLENTQQVVSHNEIGVTNEPIIDPTDAGMVEDVPGDFRLVESSPVVVDMPSAIEIQNPKLQTPPCIKEENVELIDDLGEAPIEVIGVSLVENVPENFMSVENTTGDIKMLSKEPIVISPTQQKDVEDIAPNILKTENESKNKEIISLLLLEGVDKADNKDKDKFNRTPIKDVVCFNEESFLLSTTYNEDNNDNIGSKKKKEKETHEILVKNESKDIIDELCKSMKEEGNVLSRLAPSSGESPDSPDNVASLISDKKNQQSTEIISSGDDSVINLVNCDKQHTSFGTQHSNVFNHNSMNSRPLTLRSDQKINKEQITCNCLVITSSDLNQGRMHDNQAVVDKKILSEFPTTEENRLNSCNVVRREGEDIDEKEIKCNGADIDFNGVVKNVGTDIGFSEGREIECVGYDGEENSARTAIGFSEGRESGRSGHSDENYFKQESREAFLFKPTLTTLTSKPTTESITSESSIDFNSTKQNNEKLDDESINEKTAILNNVHTTVLYDKPINNLNTTLFHNKIVQENNKILSITPVVTSNGNKTEQNTNLISQDETKNVNKVNEINAENCLDETNLKVFTNEQQTRLLETQCLANQATIKQHDNAKNDVINANVLFPDALNGTNSCIEVLQIAEFNVHEICTEEIIYSEREDIVQSSVVEEEESRNQCACANTDISNRTETNATSEEQPSKETLKKMGQLLSMIFETDNFEDVPLDIVDSLGGKVIISEDGEYAIIDIEGKKKEYKIDKAKFRNSRDFSEKIRNSRDLSQLFDQLEKLDAVSSTKVDKRQSLLKRLSVNNGMSSSNSSSSSSDSPKVFDLQRLAEDMQANRIAEDNDEKTNDLFCPCNVIEDNVTETKQTIVPQEKADKHLDDSLQIKNIQDTHKTTVSTYKDLNLSTNTVKNTPLTDNLSTKKLQECPVNQQTTNMMVETSPSYYPSVDIHKQIHSFTNVNKKSDVATKVTDEKFILQNLNDRNNKLLSDQLTEYTNDTSESRLEEMEVINPANQNIVIKNNTNCVYEQNITTQHNQPLEIQKLNLDEKTNLTQESFKNLHNENLTNEQEYDTNGTPPRVTVINDLNVQVKIITSDEDTDSDDVGDEHLGVGFNPYRKRRSLIDENIDDDSLDVIIHERSTSELLDDLYLILSNEEHEISRSHENLLDIDREEEDNISLYTKGSDTESDVSVPPSPLEVHNLFQYERKLAHDLHLPEISEEETEAIRSKHRLVHQNKFEIKLNVQPSVNDSSADDDDDDDVETPKVFEQTQYSTPERDKSFFKFSPEKIQFLSPEYDDVTFKQRSKSLDYLHLNPDLDDLLRPRSGSMEEQSKKKPSLVLSARFNPSSPRIKETNIDQLIDSLQKSHESHDLLLSVNRYENVSHKSNHTDDDGDSDSSISETDIDAFDEDEESNFADHSSIGTTRALSFLETDIDEAISHEDLMRAAFTPEGDHDNGNIDTKFKFENNPLLFDDNFVTEKHNDDVIQHNGATNLVPDTIEPEIQVAADKIAEEIKPDNDEIKSLPAKQEANNKTKKEDEKILIAPQIQQLPGHKDIQVATEIQENTTPLLKQNVEDNSIHRLHQLGHDLAEFDSEAAKSDIECLEFIENLNNEIQPNINTIIHSTDKTSEVHKQETVPVTEPKIKTSTSQPSDVIETLKPNSKESSNIDNELAEKLEIIQTPSISEQKSPSPAIISNSNSFNDIVEKREIINTQFDIKEPSDVSESSDDNNDMIKPVVMMDVEYSPPFDTIFNDDDDGLLNDVISDSPLKTSETVTRFRELLYGEDEPETPVLTKSLTTLHNKPLVHEEKQNVEIRYDNDLYTINPETFDPLETSNNEEQDLKLQCPEGAIDSIYTSPNENELPSSPDSIPNGLLIDHDSAASTESLDSTEEPLPDVYLSASRENLLSDLTTIEEEEQSQHPKVEIIVTEADEKNPHIVPSSLSQEQEIKLELSTDVKSSVVPSSLVDTSKNIETESLEKPSLTQEEEIKLELSTDVQSSIVPPSLVDTSKNIETESLEKPLTQEEEIKLELSTDVQSSIVPPSLLDTSKNIETESLEKPSLTQEEEIKLELSTDVQSSIVPPSLVDTSKNIETESLEKPSLTQEEEIKLELSTDVQSSIVPPSLVDTSKNIETESLEKPSLTQEEETKLELSTDVQSSIVPPSLVDTSKNIETESLEKPSLSQEEEIKLELSTDVQSSIVPPSLLDTSKNIETESLEKPSLTQEEEIKLELSTDVQSSIVPSETEKEAFNEPLTNNSINTNVTVSEPLVDELEASLQLECNIEPSPTISQDESILNSAKPLDIREQLDTSIKQEEDSMESFDFADVNIHDQTVDGEVKEADIGCIDSSRDPPSPVIIDPLDSSISSVSTDLTPEDNKVLLDSNEITPVSDQDFSDDQSSSSPTDKAKTGEVHIPIPVLIVTSTPRADKKQVGREEGYSDDDHDKGSVCYNVADASYVMVDTDTEPTKDIVKVAAIAEQLTPRQRQDGIKSAPCTPQNVRRRNKEPPQHRRLGKSDSWQYKSDYELSRKSLTLIESLEAEMFAEPEEEFEDFNETLDEILRVKGNLKRVAPQELYNSETSIHSDEPLTQTSDQHVTTPSFERRKFSSEQHIPYVARKADQETLSTTVPLGTKSLQNVFTGDTIETDIDDIETDIDDVDENKFKTDFKSSSLSDHIQVTNVDDVMGSVEDGLNRRFSRRFVVVSRTEKRPMSMSFSDDFRIKSRSSSRSSLSDDVIKRKSRSSSKGSRSSLVDDAMKRDQRGFTKTSSLADDVFSPPNTSLDDTSPVVLNQHVDDDIKASEKPSIEPVNPNLDKQEQSKLEDIKTSEKPSVEPVYQNLDKREQSSTSMIVDPTQLSSTDISDHANQSQIKLSPTVIFVPTVTMTTHAGDSHTVDTSSQQTDEIIVNISDEDLPSSPTSPAPSKPFSIPDLQHVSEDVINASQEEKQEEIPQYDDIQVMIPNGTFTTKQITSEDVPRPSTTSKDETTSLSDTKNISIDSQLDDLQKCAEDLSQLNCQSPKSKPHQVRPSLTRKRDSWDVIGNSPEHVAAKNEKNSKVEQGFIKKVDTLNSTATSEKHYSWNILDLKPEEEETMELFITQSTRDINSNFEQFLDLPKDEEDITNKRDSSDISYLFEKYQREREAIKRMNDNKQQQSDSLSDFSEISSVSDTSSLPDESRDKWFGDVSTIEDPSLSHETAVKTNFSPLDYLSDDEIEKLRFYQYQRDTKLDSSSSTVQSPNLNTKESHQRLQSVTSPVEVKDLPSPSKPSFIPHVSAFDDEDLGTMVIAQAASAVRRRRRGGRNRMASKEDLADPKVEAKTSDSGISDSSNNLSPREPRLDANHLEPMNLLQSVQLRRSPDLWHLNDIRIHEDPFKEERTENTPIACDQPSVIKQDHPEVTRHRSTKSSKSSTSTLNEEHIQSPLTPKQSPRFLHHDDNFSDSEQLLKRKNKKESLSYQRITSLPNLHLAGRKSSEDLDNYDGEEFFSESSLLSADVSFDQNSNVGDERFIYPSMHLRSSDQNKTSKVYDDTDTSDDDSFTTEHRSNSQDLKRVSDAERTVYCGNPPCAKEEVLLGNARSKFTSCPSCFMCYCSRSCRRQHWPEHKQICFYGRISHYIRSVIKRCEREQEFNSYLANLALDKSQALGRGYIFINFESATEAKLALVSKNISLSASPMYISLENLFTDYQKNRHTRFLEQTLIDYDLEQEFVVNISISIGNDKSNSKSRKRKSTVVRCARITISQPTQSVYGDTLSSYVIRSFTLPTNKNDYIIHDTDTRRYYSREISYSLKRCGISLKNDYPDAYEKICQYVEEDVIFLPLVLYGQKDGRNFKCILYPGKTNKSEEAYGEGVLV